MNFHRQCVYDINEAGKKLPYNANISFISYHINVYNTVEKKRECTNMLGRTDVDSGNVLLITKGSLPNN